jgi:hypothetical protein
MSLIPFAPLLLVIWNGTAQRLRVPQLSVNCISAAPAALNRYLAAVPAMSLIPFAPLLLDIRNRTTQRLIWARKTAARGL